MAVVFVVDQIRLVLGNGAANCGAFDRMKLGEENTPILGTGVNANLFLTHAGFFLARSYYSSNPIHHSSRFALEVFASMALYQL